MLFSAPRRKRVWMSSQFWSGNKPLTRASSALYRKSVVLSKLCEYLGLRGIVDLQGLLLLRQASQVSVWLVRTQRIRLTLHRSHETCARRRAESGTRLLLGFSISKVRGIGSDHEVNFSHS